MRLLRWLILLLCLLLASAVCLPPDHHLASRASSAQTRAHLSPLVFLGTLRSVLVQRDGTIRTWFALDRSLKGGKRRKDKDVEVVYYRQGGGQCILEVHQDNLVLGAQYLVFGGDGGKGEVQATALPLPNEKRTLRAVKKILCAGCAKPPVVAGLERTRVVEGEKVRLNCHLAGNPLPWVEWYKDGVRITSKGRVKVKTKRRTSRLVIRRARIQDRGVYECRAGNVVQSDPPVSIRATLLVARVPTTPATTTTTQSQFDELRKEELCPIQGYCHNGGTCFIVKDLLEQYCQCADGYRGEHCEFKDVSISVGRVKNYSSRGDIP